ncbi:T9SS type A sorting domain-containing protein [bacterium]|nr:T9SS type A sorting domain-containing protein [bacterium]
MKYIFYGFIFLGVVLLNSSWGSGNSSAESISRSLAPMDEPVIQEKFHCAGNTYLTITNWGFFGTQRGDNDPYYCIVANGHNGSCSWEEGTCLPSAEFPVESSIEYLFQGALWIGGILEGDTIVCIGEDGWTSGQHHFFPGSIDADSILEFSIDDGDPEAVSNQDFIATYTDTVTDPDYVPDTHTPLGIRIRQISHSWSTSPLDNMIIIDYTIQNIGANYIQDMYVGLYFDGDVGHINRYEYCQDDITGFIATYIDSFVEPAETIEVNTAWIADNNGDPDYEFHEFNEFSPRGACAVKVLRAPNPAISYSYNWWISNTDEAYDWGPDEMPFEPFDGTPAGLKNKYIIMSNGEFDYDQARIGEYLDDPNWLAPPEYWDNLQNGYDTRFLLSFGPFDLLPGDSLPFTFALLFIDLFHIDPTIDPGVVDPDNFEYSALAELSHGVSEFYESGYSYIPLSPPSGLMVKGVYENAVLLNWRAIEREDIDSVKIYRRISYDTYSDIPVAVLSTTDSSYLDTTVENAVTYHYAMTSVDTFGRESRFSGEVTAVPGTPSIPTGLTGVTNPRNIEVNWARNPEPDIVGYSLEKSIPDLSIYTSHFITDTFFLDTAIYRGEWTWYRIRAQDADGLHSRWTDFFPLVPLGYFNLGVLLVDATEGSSPLGNAPEDSVDVFFRNIIGDHTYYTLWDISTSGYPDLGNLSDFSSVIWYDEDRENNFRSQDLISISDYLYFGGNVWLCGRKISLLYTTPDSVYFGWDFHITNMFVPPTWSIGDTGEFTGAHALQPGYPDLTVNLDKLGQAFYGPFSTGGTIPEIAYFEIAEPAESLYAFQALHPESDFNNRVCALRVITDDHKLFYFDFPMYFMEEDQINQLTRNILDEFGELESIDNTISKPDAFRLYQNFPNPFNARTIIQFSLPETNAKSHKVELSVYNILGKKINVLVNSKLEGGLHHIIWDGRNEDGSRMSSGIYFYKISFNGKCKIKRCLLIR